MKPELILTIDLEWYFNGNRTSREHYGDFAAMSLSDRMRYDHGQTQKSVRTILHILQQMKRTVTFFVVAEMYDAYPELIDEIYTQGNEIALHSYRHEELPQKQDFERDLTRCLRFQRRYHVIGFRSPRIKITRSLYASLKKFGYRYDSSVYGTTPFTASGIRVMPVSVLPFRKQQMTAVPCGLGASLKKPAIPFGSGMVVGGLQRGIEYFIREYGRVYKQPPCVFIHSWQIRQPYYPISFLLRKPWMIPYHNECENLLKYLSRTYQLGTVRESLK